MPKEHSIAKGTKERERERAGYKSELQSIYVVSITMEVHKGGNNVRHAIEHNHKITLDGLNLTAIE